MKKNKIIIVAIIAICLLAVILLCLSKREISAPDENTTSQSEIIAPAELEEIKETSINLGNDLSITEVGKYTGIYMEDGTDETVTGIMMIAVKNEGDKTVQYAEIKLPVGEKEAFFTMSTLTPGSTIILLEHNRMEYVEGSYTTAIAENVVLFNEETSLYEDKLKIQIMDGAINVTNISEEDIREEVSIYYKNSAEDVYYGGITYRVRVEGGLKKDEIKQIMAKHLSKTGSKVMFVTFGAVQ